MFYRIRFKTIGFVIDYYVFIDWIERFGVVMDFEGDCYGFVMVFLLKIIGSFIDYFFYNFFIFYVVYFYYEFVMIFV